MCCRSAWLANVKALGGHGSTKTTVEDDLLRSGVRKKYSEVAEEPALNYAF